MIYRVETREIDTAQRLVRRGAELIHVRARVFDTIVYLIERRDRVVPRKELLDALWLGTRVSDNSVMQCINEARQVFGGDSRNSPYIRTVAKAGYQFVGPVEVVEDVGLPDHPDGPPLPAEATPEPVRTVPVPSAPAGSVRSWPWKWVAGGLTALVLAATLPTRSGPPSPEPLSLEAAWWKLDEGAGAQVRDSVTGAAAELPQALQWTRGIAGPGLLFPGSEIVIRGPEHGTVARGAAPRTMLTWIRTGSTNGDTTVLFQQAGREPHPQRDHFYLALHETGNAAFGNANLVIGRTRIDDDRWHQIAGVFEGGEGGAMRLYVDGREDAALPVHGALEPGEDRFWSIGRGVYNGTGFRGAIDDVRVFARALAPAKIRSLYRCRSTSGDIEIAGRQYYLSPVFGDNIEVAPWSGGALSAELRNTGKDFAGAAFVPLPSDCSLRSTSSADIGQDLVIEMELKVPGADGLVAQGGPYFRSRRSGAGDGLIGGASAGFWVQLESTGRVVVRRLHPMATIAFSEPVRAFDAQVFHRIEARVHGMTLRVLLDGKPVEFDASGVRRERLALDAAWETATPPGVNNGSAGVAFACSSNRGKVGGQVARNIRVRVSGSER